MTEPRVYVTSEQERKRQHERYMARKQKQQEIALAYHATNLYTLVQTDVPAERIIEDIKRYLKENFKV